MATDSPVAVLYDSNGNALTSTTVGTFAAPILSVQSPNATATATLNAVNVAATVPLAGREAGYTLAAGTFIGTLIGELSFDGGSTYQVQTYLDSGTLNYKTSSLAFASANTANVGTIGGAGGATHARIRVLAYSSGSASVVVYTSQSEDKTNTYSTSSTSPVPPETCLVGGSDGTYLRSLSTDTSGRPNINSFTQDNYVPTYGTAFTNASVATTPTDIATLYGCGSRILRVLRVRITALQTTASTIAVSLIKRSATNSGGTSTLQTLVPFSSASSASQASAASWTANPTTLGTTVGTVRQTKLYVPTATTGGTIDEIIWDFPSAVGSALILRSPAEGIAINLGGVTASGLSAAICFEWSEQ